MDGFILIAAIAKATMIEAQINQGGMLSTNNGGAGPFLVVKARSTGISGLMTGVMTAEYILTNI
jgi:hypothetical protein